MQLDPYLVRLQIDNLKFIHPEILTDDEAWLATLESETDFHEILTTIIRRIEDTKALSIGTKDRLDELKTRKDRFDHRVDTLRELAFKIMQAADLAKVELPEATLSLRAGQPQLVGDANPALVQDKYCKVSRNLNRTAIMEALKTGETVPGFSLCQILNQTSQSGSNDMKISSLLSDYLKADDLQGHEVSVVISQIKFEKMDGKDKPILFFLGKSKGLMLNKTNIKAIIALYGDETNSWNGKEITLFPKMVDFQGESVNAIRVKGPLSTDPRYSAELSSKDPISTSPRRMTGGVSDNLPPKQTNGMDDDIPF